MTTEESANANVRPIVSYFDPCSRVLCSTLYKRQCYSINRWTWGLSGDAGLFPGIWQAQSDAEWVYICGTSLRAGLAWLLPEKRSYRRGAYSTAWWCNRVNRNALKWFFINTKGDTGWVFAVWGIAACAWGLCLMFIGFNTALITLT